MLMKYNYMDIIKRSLFMYLEPTEIQSQLIDYFRLIYHQNIYKNYNSKIIHHLKKNWLNIFIILYLIDNFFNLSGFFLKGYSTTHFIRILNNMLKILQIIYQLIKNLYIRYYIFNHSHWQVYSAPKTTFYYTT